MSTTTQITPLFSGSKYQSESTIYRMSDKAFLYWSRIINERKSMGFEVFAGESSDACVQDLQLQINLHMLHFPY